MIFFHNNKIDRINFKPSKNCHTDPKSMFLVYGCRSRLNLMKYELFLHTYSTNNQKSQGTNDRMAEITRDTVNQRPELGVGFEPTDGAELVDNGPDGFGVIELSLLWCFQCSRRGEL